MIANLTHKIKPNGDITVHLMGSPLLSVSKQRLLKLLSQYLTDTDLKLIATLRDQNITIDPQDIRVSELIRVYFSHKRAFYGNRNIKVTGIGRGSAQYKAFVKALDIIDTHQVAYDHFIKAQIKGLAFANVFPKPGQLCTEDAETRLLQSIATPKSKKEIRQIRLAPDDYNLPLSKNNKFNGVYHRIQNDDTVSIEELLYCRDVILARGKKVPDSINLKIEQNNKDTND
jgi:hypothetical protein